MNPSRGDDLSMKLSDFIKLCNSLGLELSEESLSLIKELEKAKYKTKVPIMLHSKPKTMKSGGRWRLLLKAQVSNVTFSVLQSEIIVEVDGSPVKARKIAIEDLRREVKKEFEKWKQFMNSTRS
ncbi:MAG: hypothetical protein ACTSW6_01175 [Candidatus Baldrarchaeia archaeon]